MPSPASSVSPVFSHSVFFLLLAGQLLASHADWTRNAPSEQGSGHLFQSFLCNYPRHSIPVTDQFLLPSAHPFCFRAASDCVDGTDECSSEYLSAIHALFSFLYNVPFMVSIRVSFRFLLNKIAPEKACTRRSEGLKVSWMSRTHGRNRFCFAALFGVQYAVNV